MGATRFDQPAEHRFINTYTPIPFAELAAAGQARQGRFDENAARMDAAQVAVDQMVAIPNSADQAKVEQWRTQMSDFADEFIDKDLSDPEVYRKVKSGIRQIVNPNELSAIGQSHAGYLNYQKELARLEASGRGTRPELRQDFAGYSSLDSGIFTGLPKERQDWVTAADEFFKPVKEQFLGIQDVGEGYKGSVHARSGPALAEHAKNNIDQFLDTPSGAEMIDVARAQGDERSAEEIVSEYLEGLYPRYTSSRVQVLAGSNEEPEQLPTPSTSYAGAVSKAGTGEKAKDIKKATPDTEELIPGMSFGKIDSATKHFGQSATNARLKAKTEEERDAITKKYREYNKKRRETGKQLEFKNPADRELFDNYLEATAKYYGISEPEMTKMSPKEQLEKIDDYVIHKWQHKRNPEVVEYTESYRPEESKVLKNQIEVTKILDNRYVFDPTKPDTQDLGTVSELKNEYPTVAYDWTPIGETVDIPNENMALSKQVVIRDKKTGESMGEFFISGSGQEVRDSKFDNKLTQEMLYGSLPKGEFSWPVSPTEEARVRWKVDEIEGNLPVYSVIIKLPDDTEVGPFEGRNISDIRQQIQGGLQQLGQ